VTILYQLVAPNQVGSPLQTPLEAPLLECIIYSTLNNPSINFSMTAPQGHSLLCPRVLPCLYFIMLTTVIASLLKCLVTILNTWSGVLQCFMPALNVR